MAFRQKPLTETALESMAELAVVIEAEVELPLIEAELEAETEST